VPPAVSLQHPFAVPLVVGTRDVLASARGGCVALRVVWSIVRAQPSAVIVRETLHNAHPKTSAEHLPVQTPCSLCGWEGAHSCHRPCGTPPATTATGELALEGASWAQPPELGCSYSYTSTSGALWLAKQLFSTQLPALASQCPGLGGCWTPPRVGKSTRVAGEGTPPATRRSVAVVPHPVGAPACRASTATSLGPLPPSPAVPSAPPPEVARPQRCKGFGGTRPVTFSTSRACFGGGGWVSDERIP
jgi:hypothetical protein